MKLNKCNHKIAYRGKSDHKFTKRYVCDVCGKSAKELVMEISKNSLRLLDRK